MLHENLEIQLIGMGGRIVTGFMKNAACIVGIKYDQELMVNKDLAVRFISRNPTHLPKNEF